MKAYHSILAQIEKLPSDAAVKIEAFDDHTFHWDVMAVDIKNLLMAFLFVVPSLRNERNSALENVETLQEQIAGDDEGETLTWEPPKWEYMTAYLDSRKRPHDDKLNELGNDRWELVAIDNNEIYFKRPK